MASVAPRESQLSMKQSNQLQKQTSRWLNLSRTLWSLVVKDSFYDQIDGSDGELRSFFDVMEWKLGGKISDEEFSLLYAEWMKQSQKTGRSDYSKDFPVSDTQVIRQITLDRHCTEKDLFNYIGMLLHENNVNLADIPISYTMRDYPHRNYSNLELCDDSWLTLSESLFFSLDVLGHGQLQFDQIFFFCGCLIIGNLSANAGNAENLPELQLAALAGMAIQLMKDIKTEGHTATQQSQSQSTDDVSSVTPVSLPCFKLHLLHKGLGTTALSALLQVHTPTLTPCCPSSPLLLSRIYILFCSVLLCSALLSSKSHIIAVLEFALYSTSLVSSFHFSH